MATHRKLVQNVEDAIEELFSDTSVAPGVTLTDLRDARSNLDIKIGSIESDFARAAGRRS